MSHQPNITQQFTAHWMKCQNVVAAFVRTAIRDEHHAEDDSNWADAPSGRHGKGSDICEAVLWLASDKASHVAGATLRIDGGASAAMRGGARG